MQLSPQGPGNDGFDTASWDDVGAATFYGTGLGDSSGDEPEPQNRRMPFDLSPSTDEYLLFVNDSDALHGMYELNTAACDADAARCDEIASWPVSS